MDKGEVVEIYIYFWSYKCLDKNSNVSVKTFLQTFNVTSFCYCNLTYWAYAIDSYHALLLIINLSKKHLKAHCHIGSIFYTSYQRNHAVVAMQDMK